MVKRTVWEVRKAILEALLDGKPHSYGYLERKADTNWQTIRNHIKELEVFGAVNFSEEGVKVTENGRKIFQKLKNAKEKN